MKENIKRILMVVFSVMICQTPDLKIGFLKVSELLLLILLPIIFIQISKWNRLLFYLFISFTLIFILSIFVTLFTDFKYEKNILPLLKRPFFITISRYLEFLTCIVFSSSIFLYLKNKKKYIINKFLINFINLNLWIGVFFVIYYLILRQNLIVDFLGFQFDRRLSGFFTEGGNLGLFYSFLFPLIIISNTKHKIIKSVFIIIIVVFFCVSKAGIALLLFISVFFLYKRYYTKYSILSYPFIIVLFIAAILVLINLSSSYFRKIDELKILVHNSKDTNLVMGRIPGFFIAQEMVTKNPVFGIGIGNYHLLRDRKEYRTFFPEAPIKSADQAGLGGFVDLIVDSGIIGVIIFASAFIVYYIDNRRKFSKLSIYYIIFFIPFLFGLQLYFLYPYFFLGYFLTLNPKYGG